MEWIPVEERLPERLQRVLIYTYSIGERIIKEGYWRGDNWIVLIGLESIFCDVTHWMPLLEPPEPDA